MKKIVLSLFLLLTILQLSAQHDGQRVEKLPTHAFLSIREHPDFMLLLSTPPAVGSEEFEDDQKYYEWGKQLRSTPRGEQAMKDHSQSLADAFSHAAGFTISADSCPEIFKHPTVPSSNN